MTVRKVPADDKQLTVTKLFVVSTQHLAWHYTMHAAYVGTSSTCFTVNTVCKLDVSGGSKDIDCGNPCNENSMTA